MSKNNTQGAAMTTTQTQTGDLDLARIMLSSDAFLEGHAGTDADEHLGDKTPSEPGGVSIHLNGEIAEMLLAARGWKQGDNGAWYAPDGDSMHWDRADALLLALTAEAV